jgi:hypothetical protein
MRPWTQLLAAVALLTSAARAAEPHTLLIDDLGFSPAEIRKLEAGEAIARALPATGCGEVATAGAIRINVSLRHFLSRFRNMPLFKKSAEVLEVQFLDDLPKAVRQDLEVRSARYAGARNTIALAEASAFLDRYSPALWKRLRGSDSPALEEFTYWSRERIVKRPVEMLTRVLIDEHPAQRSAFIATEQVYASHYFDGSLGLTAVFETPEATYLVYINRTRAHALGGAFSGVRKSIAARILTGTLERKLAETRDRLMAQTAAAR